LSSSTSSSYKANTAGGGVDAADCGVDDRGVTQPGFGDPKLDTPSDAADSDTNLGGVAAKLPTALQQLEALKRQKKYGLRV